MSGCPTPGDDACTDMTPCTRCPSAVGLLTADEVAVGVAGQESACLDGKISAARPRQRPGCYPPIRTTGREAVAMIVHGSESPVTTPRRPTVGDA